MRFYILVFLIITIPVQGISNSYDAKTLHTIDSLNFIINNESNHDTVMYYACNQMAALTFDTNIDTTIYFLKKAIFFADRANFRNGILDSYGSIGYLYSKIGEYEKAIEYSFKALDECEKRKDFKQQSQIYNNIGFIYTLKGDNQKGIEYYNKSLNLSIELNDLEAANYGLGNLGSVYSDQGDIPNALIYLNKSLELAEFLENKMVISVSLHNIAYIHHQQGNNELALTLINQAIEIGEELGDKFYVAPRYSVLGDINKELGDIDKAKANFLKSYDLRVEIGDQAGTTASLISLGMLNLEQGDTTEGLDLLFRAMDIAEEIDNYKGMCNAYNSIGEVMYAKGKFDEARGYGNKALKILPEIGMPQVALNTYKLLSNVNANTNNGMEALNMYKLFIVSRDSISNASNQKLAINQNTKYQYEKQKALDDAERSKVEEIEAREKAEQKNLMLVIGIGLLITLVLLIFVFNRLRITRRQKKLIEAKKLEVESQKEIIEETHKEITDSINYAYRLQQAILPPLDELNKHLPNSFIYFKPKDVVSGDFYWVEKTAEAIFVAAADCTGHGVPGAMVSVVCANALNRSLKEFQLKEPSEILTKTRSLIISTFSKSSEEVKDGMDISLCKITSNKITFSGANNPLWIVRDRQFVTAEELKSRSTECHENLGLVEFKGDKQAVGLEENSIPFTQTNVDILSGDRIYLFTDGFADQFGGSKGKKYKYRPFKKTILQMSSRPMHEQQANLDKAFTDWQGDLEQVDDVCIIGIEF